MLADPLAGRIDYDRLGRMTDEMLDATDGLAPAVRRGLTRDRSRRRRAARARPAPTRDVLGAARGRATRAERDPRPRSRRAGVAHVMFATGQLAAHVPRRARRATAGVDWSRVVGFHMDEYVGHRRRPSGELPPLPARADRRAGPDPVRSTSSTATRRTPAPSARRYAALLRDHPLDLCCLGIGENGHLAFNDPPVADFDDPLDVKVVDARRRVPAPAGGGGPLPRRRRGAAARDHGHDPGAAARRDACSRSSPRPASARRCGARSRDRSTPTCPASILRTRPNADPLPRR